MNGDWVSGPIELTEEELGANRRDFYEDCLARKLDTDDYWQSRMPDWSKVKVPLFSAANWGGQGLHPRGNFEGFVRAASKQKWLECHGLEHWTHFYTDYGVALQKKFFGHFLKGENTGWDKQPKVQLQVRHVGEKFVERHEKRMAARAHAMDQASISIRPTSRCRRTPPAEAIVGHLRRASATASPSSPRRSKQDTEITGPIAAKLLVSSATEDADLFLVVRAFSPDMKEVVFQGALDPHTPIAQGWLRVSHRKLDPKLTLPYRPYHTHDEEQKLTPGEVYEVDVEVWPTCIVVPTGYRLALTVRGKDYDYRRRRRRRLEDAGHGLDRLSPSSATTIRATARPPFSAATSRCTPARTGRPICCCRSFRRSSEGGNKESDGFQLRSICPLDVAAR